MFLQEKETRWRDGTSFSVRIVSQGDEFATLNCPSIMINYNYSRESIVDDISYC